MTWTVYRDPSTGIIHATYEGDITLHDVSAATEKASHLAEGKGPHLFLTEFVNARSTLRIHEIFSLPERWEELDFNRANKLAIVVNEDESIYQDVEFHVVTARSRGWQVFAYAEKEHALNRLLGKQALSC